MFGDIVSYEKWFYWIVSQEYARLPNKYNLQLYYWLIEIPLVTRPTILIVDSGTITEPSKAQKENIRVLYVEENIEERLKQYIPQKGLNKIFDEEIKGIIWKH